MNRLIPSNDPLRLSGKFILQLNKLKNFERIKDMRDADCVIRHFKQPQLSPSSKKPQVKDFPTRPKCMDGVKRKFEDGSNAVVKFDPQPKLPTLMSISASHITAKNFFLIMQFLYFLTQKAELNMKESGKIEEPILSLLSRFYIVEPGSYTSTKNLRMAAFELYLIPVAILYISLLEFHIENGRSTKDLKKLDAWVIRRIFKCNDENCQLESNKKYSITLGKLSKNSSRRIAFSVLKTLDRLYPDQSDMLESFHFAGQALEWLHKKYIESKEHSVRLTEYFKKEIEKEIERKKRIAGDDVKKGDK